MRLICTCLTLALLLSLGGILTTAQQLDPQITLTPSTERVSLGPNESIILTWTVTNRGPTGGTVNLHVAPVDGWRFDFVQEQTFMLAREGQETRSLKVTAAHAAPNANLVLTGRITDTAGRSSQPVQSQVDLGYIAPPLPIPPPPPPATPWALIAGSTAGIVLAILTFQAGSVKVEISSPRLEITPAGSGYVRVTVRNRWWPATRVYMRVRDVPSPAVAALSLARVRLRIGEAASVPLLVKAPVDMPDGQQTLSVQARAGFLGPWIARRRVRLTFRSPVAPEAPLQPLAPIILHN